MSGKHGQIELIDRYIKPKYHKTNSNKTFFEPHSFYNSQGELRKTSTHFILLFFLLLLLLLLLLLKAPLTTCSDVSLLLACLHIFILFFLLFYQAVQQICFIAHLITTFGTQYKQVLQFSPFHVFGMYTSSHPHPHPHTYTHTHTHTHTFLHHSFPQCWHLEFPEASDLYVTTPDLPSLQAMQANILSIFYLDFQGKYGLLMLKEFFHLNTV